MIINGTAIRMIRGDTEVLTVSCEQEDGVPTVISYAPDMEAWEGWRASLPTEPEPEATTEELLLGLAADHEYRISLQEMGLSESDLI